MHGLRLSLLTALTTALAVAHGAVAHAQSVAILGAPSDPLWNDDVRAKLEATDRLDLVDIIPVVAGNETPSVDALRAFDVLFVYSDAGFTSSDELGDVLADYVDEGGGVVIATFAFHNVDGLALRGRLSSKGYVPFTQGGQNQGAALTIIPLQQQHPILAGIEVFDGGTQSYHNSAITTVVGAERIANWSNGQPLVASLETPRGRVVGLNFYPPSSAVRADFWNQATDGALLMANALAFACVDPDGDGSCAVRDDDDDNDGVADAADPSPVDPAVCGDSDGDGCDDCAVGGDGFGPGIDADPANDGPDDDGDGLCNAGDPDLDNDLVDDDVDNCPELANPDQADLDGDGAGDACDGDNGSVGGCAAGTGSSGFLVLLVLGAALALRRRKR